MTAGPTAPGFLKPGKYAAAERERRWQCAAFPDPAFAVRVVTDDPRYTGGARVRAGVPDEEG